MRGTFSGLRLAVLGTATLALAGAAAVQASQPPSRYSYARPVADDAAARELEARVRELGRAFPGEVGIAVREVDERGGLLAGWNGSRFFPQQSVSKFWVAVTALSRVDAGALDLDRSVTITRADLTLFNQPIAAQIGPRGYTTTLGSLLFRAITQSDNTCNDIVLRHAGGPSAVRAMLTRNRLDGIRFGPGERLLQAGIAGMQWHNAFSVGRGFEAARSQVPASRRRSAFERYIDDPVDGATPDGITNGLARLQRGELLSRASTARLLSIMSQVRTGRMRLRGGLAPGWSIGHKTGSGQVFNGIQAGYNDIGILTSPDGRHYAVAVMIGRTSAPNLTRMQLMQNVTRAVIAYDEARRGDGYVPRRMPVPERKPDNETDSDTY
jgi:beta-lactamase class A